MFDKKIHEYNARSSYNTVWYMNVKIMQQSSRKKKTKIKKNASSVHLHLFYYFMIIAFFSSTAARKSNDTRNVDTRVIASTKLVTTPEIQRLDNVFF